MKAKKAITAGLLVICGALVFFVISSDTAMSSGLSDEEALVRSADEIGNLALEEMTEWLSADIPEEFLVELQERMEKLFIALDKSELLFTGGKQIPPDFCERYLPYCIYSLLNHCGILTGINSWPEGDVPPPPKEGAILDENLKEQEPFTKDDETPDWFAHFAGREVDDTSYIEVSYNGNVGIVPGEVRFTTYDDGITPPVKTIPIIWWTSLSNEDIPQREYFSCYVNFDIIDEHGDVVSRPSDRDWWKLLLLGMYWILRPSQDQQVAARKTFINHCFCEDWFCSHYPPNYGKGVDTYGKCVEQCRNYLFLFLESDTCRDKEKGWDGGWYESSLLAMATHFRWWRSNEWFVNKSVEYFDDITLHVNIDIPVTLETLTVVLNGVTILSCNSNDFNDPQSPCNMINPTISPTHDVELVDPIREYRIAQVEGLLDPNEPDHLMTTLLEEVAKNLGQSWATKYTGTWGKRCEDPLCLRWSWNPTPDVWCSEFACYMIKWHGIDSWYENQDCDPIDVRDMWVKFRYTDEDDDKCSDRISPITEQIPNPSPPPYWDFYEFPACAESWAELADLVKPGYYGGWYEEDKDNKGEKNMHSFFFVEWESGWEPIESDGVYPIYDGECEARFRYTGGNQGGGRVTIGGTKSIYNVEEGSGCPTPPDNPYETEMVWGHRYNFFGIVGDK